MTSPSPKSPAEPIPQVLSRLREALSAHLQGGAIWPAVQVARQLLDAEPGIRTFRFLRKLLESSSAESLGFVPFKVALLSSFSIEFVHDALVAQGFASGLNIDIHQAGFGAFRQELLDPASALYREAPQAVVLAVDADAWIPESRREALRTAADVEAAAEGLQAEFRALVRALRSRSTAALLVHNIALPAWPRGGMTDSMSPAGGGTLVARLNAALAAVAQSESNVYILDYAALVNRFGTLHWHDERMRLYARAPVAQPMYGHLANEYVKFFRALSGLTKKCLVLDLDNTLWGGVIGEEGVTGIKLGTDYPGSAFVEFQKYILGLQDRGVVLAVASKNNPADVDEVLAKHQSMVLQSRHFSEMQVNWQPKSVSVAQIAKRLNLGLEHVVFVDDNPVECEQLREALPMVTVVQLPAEPEKYIAALARDGWFDSLSVSAEDRRRGELYRQRDEAEAMREASASLEDFYRQLEMELIIAPVDESTVARAAQLTQKTNQFNITTKRYSDADILRVMQDPEWVVRTVAVRDRFGDNGIVGLMMARLSAAALEIDTLLLSCRVIGRTVETAMLACLCDEARRSGCARLTGMVVPTPKNIPVRDLFERHGFAKGSGENEVTAWSLELGEKTVAWPAWFRVMLRKGADTVPEHQL